MFVSASIIFDMFQYTMTKSHRLDFCCIMIPTVFTVKSLRIKKKNKRKHKEMVLAA